MLSLALSACGGGSGGASAPAVPTLTAPHVGNVNAQLSFTLAKQTARNAATVDAGTLSVSVVVNALAPQVFNVAPGVGGCTSTPPISCTIAVNAPGGSDTFAMTTYSASNAGGVALDAGTTTHTITINATNAVSLTLMPVVSTSADSGAGSLRYAIAAATAGDTITFLASAMPSIALATPIVVTTNNLTISGPGTSSLTIVPSSTGAFEVDTGTTTSVSGIKFSGGACAAGCAFVGTGTMHLTKLDFESNSATAQGAAISGSTGSAITVANSIFNLNSVSNTAHAYGGAIYSNGTLTINGSTFTNNSATSTSTGIGAQGGAIYGDSSSSVLLLDDTFTANATNNTSSPSAGTLGNSAGGAIASAGLLTVHGGTFTSNTATAVTVQDSFGGAIYMTGNFSILTVDGVGAMANPIFSQNTAENGGAIQSDATSGGPDTLRNVTFTQNSTPAPLYGMGGALDLEGSDVWNMTNVTFSNNTASSRGGAVEYNNTNTLTLTNSSFTTNSVTGTNSTDAAGAIDVELGGYPVVNHMTNVTFTGNTSNGRAGAILDYSGYNNVYQNCTFTNNSSVFGGGAFYDSTGAIISGSTFRGNSTTGSVSSSPVGGVGGAIYIDRLNPKIDTSTFDANSATVAGGGIYVDPANGIPVSIVTSTVSNNTVSGTLHGGGGLYINNRTGNLTVALTNDTIYNNSAANASGGGIYNAAPSNSSAPVIVDFVTLANNSANAASGNGGNIYNSPASTLLAGSVTRRPNRFRHASLVQPFTFRRPLALSGAMMLTNSILVGGTAYQGPDLNDATGTSGSYDFLGTPVIGSFTGATVSAAYQSGLGAFALNSPGITNTLAVLVGSALINAVPLGSCDQTKDQRGNARPGSTACTPGAYEYP